MDTIILVPGGGGSRLTLKSQEIWPPNFNEIIFGYQRTTELQDSRVKATKVLDVYPPGAIIPCYEVYRPLQDDLNKIAQNLGSNRIDFAYDWRKDISWAANELASKIASAVSAGSTSITLVGHSMGNLLARVVLESGDYSNKNWFSKIGRYVGICGPHRGVPEILEYVLGLSSWVSISASDMRIVSANSAYAACYQCLPFQNIPVLVDIHIGPQNFYDPGVANTFGLNQQNLDAAKVLQSKISFAQKPNNVNYTLIAGSQQSTDELIDFDGVTFQDIVKDSQGDGTIPLWSTTSPQINSRVTPGDHIGIFKSYPFRQILYEILTAGTLAPELSLVEIPGITLSLNAITYLPHEPIDVLIIPDLATQEISGTLEITRVATPEVKKPRFVRYREQPVTYQGPQIRFIHATMHAPADLGAYRISFKGSHGTSPRTAATFAVVAPSAGGPRLFKDRH